MIIGHSLVFSLLPLGRALTQVAPLISSSALLHRHPGALATLFGFYVAASERMAVVESEVEGKTLNDLYLEKACAADVQ